MNAAALRKEVLARRQAMSPEELKSRSAQVIVRFTGAVPTSRLKGLRMGLYRASLPGELDLEDLERHLVASGTRLFFPRVVKNRGLEFVEAGAEATAWQRSVYGVHEPHPELPAADPRELDALLVPGVAFGAQGERIGMGAGYYDRFLARIERPLRVALAFDFQVFDRLEQNPWDQPMDWVLAETRDCRNERARGWLEGA